MFKMSVWLAWERYFFIVITIFGFFVFIILFCRFFIISPNRVNGPSMEKTFVDEDLFFVDRFHYLFTSPKRYDVVQLVEPDSDKLLIKRIVGLPGEKIAIKRGGVFVLEPGSTVEYRLLENYLQPGTYTQYIGEAGGKEYLVGDHEYFVLGDNRPHSIDSRYYGPIHRSKIIGKVLFVN